MNYVAVTLNIPVLRQTKDLLLPLDIPQYALVDGLVEALDIKDLNGHEGFLSTIDFEGGKRIPLPLQGTLRDVGIKFGQLLTLEFKETEAKFKLLCQGRQFNIVKNDILIGCHQNIDVDLRSFRNQEYVSGRHARIFYGNDGYFLVDEGSSNGTKVNNIPLDRKQEYLLEDGDKILLGDTEETGVELVFKLRK